MSVAFGGMDELVVTFKGTTGDAGKPAMMNGNRTVKNASGGVAPIGVIRNVRNGHVAVQVKGYAEVSYSGSTVPALGWNTLVADGSGGLRVAADDEKGMACRVVYLNGGEKIMGLFL